MEWSFRSGGRNFKTAVKGRLLANNGDTTLSAASRHQGIARLPDLMVCDHLRTGELVEVLGDFRPADGGLFAVYAQHRQNWLAVQALVQHLCRVFNEPGWRLADA